VLDVKSFRKIRPSTRQPESIAILISIFIVNKMSWMLKNDSMYIVQFKYLLLKLQIKSSFYTYEQLWRCDINFSYLHANRDEKYWLIISKLYLRENNKIKYFFSFNKWQPFIFWQEKTVIINQGIEVWLPVSFVIHRSVIMGLFFCFYATSNKKQLQ
jgi:hypothetical protein